MNGSNKTIKIICAALAAVVVILLLVLAFLLGQRSAGGNQNTTAPSGQSSSVSTTVPTGENHSGSIGTNPSDGQTTAPSANTVGTPRNLEVSMSAGSLTFVAGDAFRIDYDKSVIKVTENGDSVTIENDHSHPTASQRRRMDVKVTVPEGYAFDSVDIEMGAGKMIVHSLTCDALDLELGAGSATIDNVVVIGSAEIQEGAGELAIKGGQINNLTLQCGAGATRVTAKLTGTNTVNAAVGAVDLKFDGAPEDYTVAFQMGLGACYYNNEKIARNGSFGEGPTLVSITGGLGVMRVNVG
jgi:hypothetical protein